MPSIRAVSYTTSNQTSYSVPKPTGTQAGDLLIAFHVGDWANLSDMTAPAGWELIDQATVEDSQFGTITHVKLWQKRAGADEPSSYTFTQGQESSYTSAGGVVIYALQNAAYADHARSTYNSSGSSVQTPSVPGAVAGDIDLRLAAGYPDDSFNFSRSWTSPAGFTERVDAQAGEDCTFTSASRTIASAGATGTATFTASGALAPRQGWSVLISEGSMPADIEVDGPINLSVDIPSHTTSASSTSRPGMVGLAAQVPAHAVSAGQSPRAEGIWPKVTVHAPTVAAGTVTLVHAPAVTPAVLVPAPVPQIGQSIMPDPAAPLVTVATPAIDAQQQHQIAAPLVEPRVIVPASFIDVPVLPGDKITQSGQIEWNGFLMGAGTPYRILEIQGWDDLPPIDSGNVPRPTGHGAFPGRPQAGERIINLALQIAAPDILEFRRLIEDLEAVGGVPDTEDEYPIVIRLGNSAYLVYGQLRARTPGTVNRHYALGFTRNAALQWVCSDPRRYSLIRHGVTIDVDDPTEVWNQGNTSTQPEIRIHGPVTTPRLEIEETGAVIAFDLTVGEDSRLDIDIKAGTAVIGNTSVTGKLTGSVPLTDWVLRPGFSTISYTAASGGAGGIDIFWRDAWT